MATQLPKDIELARRSTHQRRSYLVDCPVCLRWSSVPTLNVQSICREAGCCLDCMRNDYFVIKVRIAAIEAAMESIVKRGKRLPEDQRPALREVYARKAGQLARAQAQLKVLEAQRERHKSIARGMA